MIDKDFLSIGFYSVSSRYVQKWICDLEATKDGGIQPSIWHRGIQNKTIDPHNRFVLRVTKGDDSHGIS